MFKFLSPIKVLLIAFTLIMQTHLSFAEQVTYKITRPGEVYLLRGLANVFSLGLDQMHTKFLQNGARSEIHNHKAWQDLAEKITTRHNNKQISHPIIIIGHSLGARAAGDLATRLGSRGIPVKYVVMYDPVEQVPIGKNITEAVNFYLPKDNNTNVAVAIEGFKGNLQNINVRPYGGFSHLNIDYNEEIRSVVYHQCLKYSDDAKKAKKE